MIMKRNLGVLSILGASMAMASAQGTIQFLNSSLSKVKYQTGAALAVDAPTGTKIGVFWGTDAAGASAITGLGRGTLVTPTASIGATPGIWYGGAVYPIPGTEQGQRVWLKIAGWDAGVGDNFAASFHYGERLAVSVALGPTAGPGTVVWQSAAGVATDRMKPFFIMGNPIIPEPSVLAMSAVAGAWFFLSCRRRGAR